MASNTLYFGDNLDVLRKHIHKDRVALTHYHFLRDSAGKWHKRMRSQR